MQCIHDGCCRSFLWILINCWLITCSGSSSMQTESMFMIRLYIDNDSYIYSAHWPDSMIPRTETHRNLQRTLYVCIMIIYLQWWLNQLHTHTIMQSKRSQTIRPTQEPSYISSKYAVVDPSVFRLQNRPIYEMQCSLMFGISWYFSRFTLSMFTTKPVK